MRAWVNTVQAQHVPLILGSHRCVLIKQSDLNIYSWAVFQLGLEEKSLHFYVSNLKEFSGEDRFKNGELLQQLFWTKIIFPCHVRLKDLRLYVLYSFKRRCFSDLITHQHFSCPSVSSLRYSLRETNLKSAHEEAASVAGVLASTLPLQARVWTALHWPSALHRALHVPIPVQYCKNGEPIIHQLRCPQLLLLSSHPIPPKQIENWDT